MSTTVKATTTLATSTQVASAATNVAPAAIAKGKSYTYYHNKLVTKMATQLGEGIKKFTIDPDFSRLKTVGLAIATIFASVLLLPLSLGAYALNSTYNWTKKTFLLKPVAPAPSQTASTTLNTTSSVNTSAIPNPTIADLAAKDAQIAADKIAKTNECIQGKAETAQNAAKNAQNNAQLANEAAKLADQGTKNKIEGVDLMRAGYKQATAGAKQEKAGTALALAAANTTEQQNNQLLVTNQNILVPNTDRTERPDDIDNVDIDSQHADNGSDDGVAGNPNEDDYHNVSSKVNSPNTTTVTQTASTTLKMSAHGDLD